MVTPSGERVDADELMALLEQRAIDQARRSFWAYRQYLDPKLKRGWWQRTVARRLQRFRDDLLAGRRPILAIVAPPQHGKSRMAVEFATWLSGGNPDIQTIYASFSDDLGVRANGDVQKIYDSLRFRAAFPELRISDSNVVSGVRWKRNASFVQHVERRGSFRNTTVRGAVTGQGLDFGIVDDPIKGRKEASSKTVREDAWLWFLDDFYSRFSEEAGLLFIMTRWHVDDPLGRMERMRDVFPALEIATYPALALNYEYDDAGELLREPGEALFPEHKSREFLEIRRRAMLDSSWQSLYQGAPVTPGDLFSRDQFVLVPQSPPHSQIVRTVRYWDKAGSHGAGAYTAGVRMHELADGRWFVSHVFRRQLSYHERELRIKQTAESDRMQFPDIRTYVEQEPGSGGKESAERTIANLAGHPVFADRPVGDKELRAEPWAAQVQGGNALVLDGQMWTDDYIEEHEMFPNGVYKDQVDASSGAFAMIAGVGGKRAGVLF